MKTQIKRRGRPKKSSSQLQSEYLDVRLVPAEKESFKEAADIAGLPLSAWVRERLRHAAVRELEAAGRKIAFLRNQD